MCKLTREINNQFYINTNFKWKHLRPGTDLIHLNVLINLLNNFKSLLKNIVYCRNLLRRFYSTNYIKFIVGCYKFSYNFHLQD